MALLQIRGLAKSFRTLQALDGVDVDVQAGTFHGLIGPNGSGKSTLLKAIAGAHFADGGTIVFDGHDITRATPYERARLGLALKFQIGLKESRECFQLLRLLSRICPERRQPLAALASMSRTRLRAASSPCRRTRP